jgi:hypothetical protein
MMDLQQKTIQRTPQHIALVTFDVLPDRISVQLKSVQSVVGDRPNMDDLIDETFNSIRDLRRITVERMRETPEDLLERIIVLPEVLNDICGQLGIRSGTRPASIHSAAFFDMHGNLVVRIRYDGKNIERVLTADEWLYYRSAP